LVSIFFETPMRSSAPSVRSCPRYGARPSNRYIELTLSEKSFSSPPSYLLFVFFFSVSFSFSHFRAQHFLNSSAFPAGRSLPVALRSVSGLVYRSSCSLPVLLILFSASVPRVLDPVFGDESAIRGRSRSIDSQSAVPFPIRIVPSFRLRRFQFLVEQSQLLSGRASVRAFRFFF